MKILARLSLILLMMTGCKDSCNNCLEVTTKSIVVLDFYGNNLLYGIHRVYHPDSVRLVTATGENVLLLQKPTPGFLEFVLEKSNYRLFLNDTTVDTIDFTLALSASQKCCGDRLYSTSTSLDNREIINSDTIIITRKIN